MASEVSIHSLPVSKSDTLGRRSVRLQISALHTPERDNRDLNLALELHAGPATVLQCAIYPRTLTPFAVPVVKRESHRHSATTLLAGPVTARNPRPALLSRVLVLGLTPTIQSDYPT